MQNTHDTRSAVKVQGQTVKCPRLQHDIMGAKNKQIINNSSGNCSISLKFYMDFDHMTHYVQQMFKVKGSKFMVTA